MVLLIDTNIVLDVLLNRPEFVKDSAMIWKLCETEQMKGYISTLTYANMMYVMRKQLTPEQIEEVFRKLSLIFEFADFQPCCIGTSSEHEVEGLRGRCSKCNGRICPCRLHYYEKSQGFHQEQSDGVYAL